ncbi:hypothetical protein PF003_g38859 [Phytophthora fragariae]|nr:hypothetical protein PF003_g38859 [Phytophthora fragariae]
MAGRFCHHLQQSQRAILSSREFTLQGRLNLNRVVTISGGVCFKGTGLALSERDLGSLQLAPTRTLELELEYGATPPNSAKSFSIRFFPLQACWRQRKLIVGEAYPYISGAFDVYVFIPFLVLLMNFFLSSSQQEEDHQQDHEAGDVGRIGQGNPSIHWS